MYSVGRVDKCEDKFQSFGVKDYGSRSKSVTYWIKGCGRKQVL